MNLRLCVIAFSSAALLGGCNNDKTKSTESKDTTSTTNPVNQNRYTSKSIEVPGATRTTFEEKYPQASNVTWSNYHVDLESPIEWDWVEWPANTNDYVANFQVDTTDYWVWYDDSGNWVGTVTNISDYSTLPAPVNTRLRSDFQGYTIISVNKENDKNRTAYEIRLEKGADLIKLMVDENGKVMKKKGTVNGVEIKVKNNPKDSM